MSEQHYIHLINARLDGALEQGGIEELEDILASSAEARATQAEFESLADIFETQAEQEPPEGLRQQILQQIVLPPKKPLFSLDRLYSAFQPATAGLAFAAGLLLTVALYEFNMAPGMATDTKHLSGTMVASERELAFERSDQLSFDEPGLAGSVTLMRAENISKLSFDLDSKKRIAIKVEFAEAGLRFGGISHTDLSGKLADETFAVADGNLRVENQGQQAFDVFLTDAVGAGDDSRGIQVRIYSGQTILFSGVFKIDSQQ